jgi:hypothetical protein
MEEKGRRRNWNKKLKEKQNRGRNKPKLGKEVKWRRKADYG